MSSYDPLDLRGQEKARSDQDTATRLARETEESDFRWLMGSKRGRRIVWRLLERAGVYRSSFNTNAAAMAFAEGNRNEGLRTVSLIHALCPELYPVMVKENAGNERSSNNDAGS